MDHPNGTSSSNKTGLLETENILHAIQVIHNPRTHNDVRREASNYLEQLKSGGSCMEYGAILSTDQSKEPLVRHFGLLLLDHTLRHQAYDLDDENNSRLRRCIIELGAGLTAGDAAFVRNKVAELWAELAKRSWGLDWNDLDPLLAELWSKDAVHELFVLTILETLSEDTFAREDTTAILRGKDLNAALVEIFTSPADYEGGIKIGADIVHLRHGEEGWLRRISHYIESQQSAASSSREKRDVLLKALATFRSVFGWIMPKAVVSADCLRVICNCLTQDDEDTIVAALDALISLYHKRQYEQQEVESLVHPLCQAQSVAILQQVYTWSVVGIDEVSSNKYAISKKLSELASGLSEILLQHPPTPNSTFDPTSFLQFLITVTGHTSLIVSIPTMHAWNRLLEVPGWRQSSAVESCIAPLLKVASSRLILYDQLPEDTNEEAVLFVNEEIEVFPERAGFHLNYRRFTAGIIEWICFAHIEEAMNFLLAEVDSTFGTIIQTQTAHDPNSYERTSSAFLKADTQFSVVDAAYKGLERWRSMNKSQESVDQRARVSDRARQWIANMLSQYKFQDPHIKQRQIKTAVECASRAFPNDNALALSILEHILASLEPTRSEQSAYADAIAELNGYATAELRRLAAYHADYFASFYEQLSDKFGSLITSLNLDARIQLDLKAVLFLIVQRASSQDAQQQKERLWSFVEPIANVWRDESVWSMWESAESFSRGQAFDLVLPYLQSFQAGQIQDWTAVETNADGLRLQERMKDASQILPLRETRVLLSISTDRLEEGSQMQSAICELWMPFLEPMLTATLRIASFSHRLHAASSWSNDPAVQERLVRRILRDRYWQSGISDGSVGSFHAGIKSSKTSLEGFASSVRGRIRINLEQCYSIVHTLGRLGDVFFSMPRIPDMIAQDLIASAQALNTHHFGTMLQMLPKLIEECPPAHRQHFLTPIMSELLKQTDSKLLGEWQKIDHQKEQENIDDNLSDEMREESILRTTTSRAVAIFASWMNPTREMQLAQKKNIVNNSHLTNGHDTQLLYDFVLSTPAVLVPLLQFCTHALTFKDNRPVNVVLTMLQNLVPAYTTEDHLQGETASEVREYISSELLKVAVMGLNDGYFADQHQYFARLIATIWVSYGLPSVVPASEKAAAHQRPPLTNTPKNLLLSLPGMTEEKLDAAATKLIMGPGQHGSTKSQRKNGALILNLLETVRGVRLSELGKIDTRAQQSRILEKYKQRENLGMQGLGDGQVKREEGVDEGVLGGVADMFG